MLRKIVDYMAACIYLALLYLHGGLLGFKLKRFVPRCLLASSLVGRCASVGNSSLTTNTLLSLEEWRADAVLLPLPAKLDFRAISAEEFALGAIYDMVLSEGIYKWLVGSYHYIATLVLCTE